MNKVIVDELFAENPSSIIEAVADILKQERQSICKQGPGTILRKKNLDDFLSFRWEALNKEMSVSCPNLMTIMSSVVSDVPLQIDSKPFHHMLVSTAKALHGRNQEILVISYSVHHWLYTNTWRLHTAGTIIISNEIKTLIIFTCVFESRERSVVGTGEYCCMYCTSIHVCWSIMNNFDQNKQNAYISNYRP